MWVLAHPDKVRTAVFSASIILLAQNVSVRFNSTRHLAAWSFTLIFPSVGACREVDGDVIAELIRGTVTAPGLPAEGAAGGCGNLAVASEEFRLRPDPSSCSVKCDKPEVVQRARQADWLKNYPQNQEGMVPVCWLIRRGAIEYWKTKQNPASLERDHNRAGHCASRKPVVGQTNVFPCRSAGIWPD